MMNEQTRVSMMTDEERVAFCKGLDVNDYRAIPGYWNEHLEEKIARIHALQQEACTDGTSFGVIADFHFTVNCLHSPAMMEKVLTECSIPYFFLAGDFVSGMGMVTPENLINEIVTVRRLFNRIEDKMLVAQGNHDPAYSTVPGHGYGESLTHEQVYEYMFRFQTQYSNRTFGPGGTYFYADDAANKMRYIVLDSHDTPNDDLLEDGLPVYPKMTSLGFRQEQISWFANVALKVPASDWTVVLCTHETVIGDNEVYFNRDLVLGLIDAFRKHTAFEGTSSCSKPLYNASVSADFTGAGGNFAVWVGGHTHRNLEQHPNGILLLTTASDSFNAIGTIEEQAFDIFTINKKTHKLYATRIGRGESREFSYDVF